MKFYLFQVVFVLVAILDASPDLFAENTIDASSLKIILKMGWKGGRYLTLTLGVLSNMKAIMHWRSLLDRVSISHRFGVPVTLL